MSFFKHVQLHKYDITDKGIKQACYDEMKADGYDIVITEKEMQVLAKHRCEEFKNYMRPPVSYTHLTLPTICSV